VFLTVRNRKNIASRLASFAVRQPNGPSIQDMEAEEVQVGTGDVRVLLAQTKEDWRHPVIEYFKSGTLPEDKAVREQLKKRALRYNL
jgi:hypothetical protein